MCVNLYGSFFEKCRVSNVLCALRGLSLAYALCKEYLAGSGREIFIFFGFGLDEDDEEAYKAICSVRAVSSAGRASPSHGGGRRFKSCTAHHYGTVVKSVYNAGLSRRRPRVQVPSVPPDYNLVYFIEVR